MTPARRKKILKAGLSMLLLFLVGGVTRLVWNVETLPSRLMGRGRGAAAPGVSLAQPLPSLAAKAGPAVKESIPVGGHAEKMNFSILGKWKYLEGKTPIPSEVKALDGRIFEFTGFMMPINEVKNIRQFILIQSLWGCCFGQPPEANHIIVVSMEPGRTVDFYPDPIRVTGRFSVGETREEGFLISIYRLEASKVEVK